MSIKELYKAGIKASQQVSNRQRQAELADDNRRIMLQREQLAIEQARAALENLVERSGLSAALKEAQETVDGHLFFSFRHVNQSTTSPITSIEFVISFKNPHDSIVEGYMKPNGDVYILNNQNSELVGDFHNSRRDLKGLLKFPTVSHSAWQNDQHAFDEPLVYALLHPILNIGPLESQF